MGILPPVLLSILACSLSQPLDQDALGEVEDMKELLVSLFIEHSRTGREMGGEEEEKMSNLVDTEEEVLGTVTGPQEIARFNNYMDAIYRRMNAALRAKLMDPMVLNMNAKVDRDTDEENKNKKKRVQRDTGDEEDDEEDEVDRMGEVDMTEEQKK